MKFRAPNLARLSLSDDFPIGEPAIEDCFRFGFRELSAPTHFSVRWLCIYSVAYDDISDSVPTFFLKSYCFGSLSAGMAPFDPKDLFSSFFKSSSLFLWPESTKLLSSLEFARML